MKKLSHLKPQPIFSYFEEICNIPRPSKKEEKIRKFLLDFADTHKLKAKSDSVGNILISKPAQPGREDAPTVILQAHMDMVCEKNSDKVFNFDEDPIEPMVVDGWIKANGTTLGADCGIGMAAQLAVLASDDIEHGPIECLMTVDEETGLTGAFALQPGFMNGSILINLDSEDEGELFIGCAGGVDTTGILSFNTEKIPQNNITYKFSVSGLKGGHSGDDIHKNRGNAIKVLTRFLWSINNRYSSQLIKIDGGNLRNAIPREAEAVISFKAEDKDQIVTEFLKFKSTVEHEFEFNEPDILLNFELSTTPDEGLSKTDGEKLLNLLYAMPHGVFEMSSRMEGMVETSTNLASVKSSFTDKTVTIATSQRSEIESRKWYAAEIIRSLLNLAGADAEHSAGYPGWTPNPNSEILKRAVASYETLFGEKPIVRSIHAGLECGLFLEKYPHLDMVSFGPTIYGAHSPDERLNIETTDKFRRLLTDILESIR